ncbi:hypothetical protein AB1L30_05205 [Bremerella sp. JC817]|uniref:hypothetical protein n=1 Tax=Bremerella sp. JC817 TaxID=3231756 RepID=UPI0034588059
MELELKPHVGTDLLPFGTPRSEVRDGLLAGKQFVTRTSEPRNDFYVSDGLILGYDDQDTLEFIEVFSPSKATFDGIELTDKATKVVIAEFEKRGTRFRSTTAATTFASWESSSIARKKGSRVRRSIARDTTTDAVS